MTYTRFITTLIFILLGLSLGTAMFFFKLANTGHQKIDYSDKIHQEIYSKAVDYWDAGLETELFQPTTILEENHSSSSYINLKWQKPEQKYNYFLITVTEPDTGWTRTEGGEHERVSLGLSDLKPNTLYTFVVQACLDRDCADWITSQNEVSGRTDKMLIQILDKRPDTTNAKTSEIQKENKPLEDMVLLDPTGQVLTDEEKQNFQLKSINTIYIPKQSSYALIEFIKQENGVLTPLFAKLLNP